MDIYTASNFLDCLELVVPDAVIIDETTAKLHDAAAATSDDTYLIHSSYPVEDLTAACTTGVTVYSPPDDHAIHVSTDDTTTLVELSTETLRKLREATSCRVLIPVDPYNSIEATILPEDHLLDLE